MNEAWREYHEKTKHTAEVLRRNTHTLDWANMPEPFRNYEGVPLLDLPADPVPPAIPTLEVLQGRRGSTQAHQGASWLSELLYHSAAISAAKTAPSGLSYALRVNPSSGNLHPTEFHFFTRGLRDWPDGLYHYRASSHMAEQRALGTHPFASAPVVFLLTTIAWREAWKYQDRAYRYCLHDIGHAWQSLALAARAIGCDTYARADFADTEAASAFGLPADEWPMLKIDCLGPTIPLLGGPLTTPQGEPKEVSQTQVPYPAIEQIHQAAAVPSYPAVLPSRPFGEAARTRRSALDFAGGSMTRPQLQALLSAAAQPLEASSFIDLYLYIHGVEGVEPGVYRALETELELIKPGDQRVAAAGLSLGQNLAGNACLAISMLADLDRATKLHGDRGYRYAHFEAGAIGHRLYLAAEALRLQSTGIGAFFDDRVHHYLDLTPERGQVIYHFAIGHAIPDPRLGALAI